MDSPGYLSLEFGGDGGAVVNVSISDLVDGALLRKTRQKKYCDFGIFPEQRYKVNLLPSSPLWDPPPSKLTLTIQWW